MNGILYIDEESQVANVEAGIFGPELEEQLRQKGFTFGHFPQSFEFSTLGGWIAARSSGQNSILYGGIEKLVVSLRILTPNGVIETQTAPREAMGPSIKELLIGSEGVYGIIISATVKIKKIPKTKRYFLYAFKDFELAERAARSLFQSGNPMAMIRVSDEDEMEAMLAMGKSSNKIGFIAEIIKLVGKRWLEFKGINPKKFAGIMIGVEGDDDECRKTICKARKILDDLGGFYLGTGPGNKWLKDRFVLPYFRDEFLDNDLLIDTLETATTWSNLLKLHKEVKSAISGARKDGDSEFLVYAHISHLYSEGASLYFTIIGKQRTGHALEQWQEMKQAASEVILKNNAVISHHHGIGMDHKKYAYRKEIELEMLRLLKRYVDPMLIMNPEKLF